VEHHRRGDKVKSAIIERQSVTVGEVELRPIPQASSGPIEHRRRNIDPDDGASGLGILSHAGSSSTADIQHLPLRPWRDQIEGDPAHSRLHRFNELVVNLSYFDLKNPDVG
jgi:hypothetical protein